MKKHEFTGAWPVGHCRFCGQRTGLDLWQISQMPKMMAECIVGVKASWGEWLSGNYNCLAKKITMKGGGE